MKINKKEILSALKADMKDSEAMQTDWDVRRKTWLDETYGNPYGNEVKGKSQIVSKDIKRQLDWMLPGITDPFLNTTKIISCNPVTAEDVEAARQNELVLNTQFCRMFPRYNFIKKLAMVLGAEGTAIVQTGWDYDEEIIKINSETIEIDEDGNEYIVEEEVEHTNIILNQPTAVVCRNEDIFIDPTCQDDMDKCQFVIHRYETNLSNLKKDGRYKNLNKITGGSSVGSVDYESQDSTYFEFKDEPRKKLVIHEYWGNYDIDGTGITKPIVCAWIGDTIVRLESNPYPDKKPPFIVAAFNQVPFQMFGEALAENISDNQKIKTGITRGMIDNMAQSNNAQVGTKKMALDQQNLAKFRKGENFEFNGSPSDFWQGSYNQFPASIFSMLTLMNNEIEAQTGVKSFSGGISGTALGSTATSAKGAMDAASARRMDIVRNISENIIKPLMRKWMSYNSEFLDDEEVFRITNDEFVPIRRDDLAGKVDLDIGVATAEDNAAKAQELSMLMQTVGPNEDPVIRREIMAQIMDLMNMPAQAKILRDFQPQVDPMAQRKQELAIEREELELEKMRADIADKLARAGENEVDRELKLMKVEVERAKVRKLGSDADVKDIEFLERDEGVQHTRDMDKKEFDRKSNLDSMAFQKMNGGPTEQIGIIE